MDKRQSIIVAAFGAILAVAVTALIVMATRPQEVIIADFKAPPFDGEAVFGVPEEAFENGDYHQSTVQGCYTFSVCGEPVFENGRLYPYFASNEGNDVWLLIKVYGSDGAELGKSGLIRPGECIPSVKLSAEPKGDEIRIKIFSYEPDTYFSRGSASATLALIKR
jgi:hypothetical protein